MWNFPGTWSNNRLDFLRLDFLAFALLMAFVAPSCSTSGASMSGSDAKNKMFVVGEWNGMVGRDLTIFNDGSVLLQDGSVTGKSARLTSPEVAQLTSLLSADGFEEALERLGAGYQPGCCDVHEVVIFFQSKQYGFPVCEQGRPIEEPVERFVELVNRLAGEHFHSVRRRPFPVSACLARTGEAQ